MSSIMKFLLASLSVSLAVAASCMFESDQTLCPAVQSFDCADQCKLYMREDNCPTTCEWNTSSMFGMTFSTCGRVSGASSCYSGSDDASCALIANCKWTQTQCGWKEYCKQNTCSGNQTQCAALAPACEWNVERSYCSSVFSFDSDVCDQPKTDATCGTTAGCEWNRGCEDREPCDGATLGECTDEAACFWSEMAGSVKVTGMGMSETTPAESGCRECFSDIAKTENFYQGVKDNINSGCSLYASVDLFGMSMEMSGSVDLISATPSGLTCVGGTPLLTPGSIGPKDEFSMDCSYAVGQAPFGTSAVAALVPSALVLLAAACM